MGEINSVQGPGRARPGVGLPQGRPEEGELVTEGLAFLAFQVPHPIPPLGLELRVGSVVGGKLPGASRRRPFESSQRPRPRREQGRN